LTRVPHDGTVDYSFYLPSVQVENLKNIPHGLEGDEIEASLCMKFRYIGRHHYYDINADVAHSLYDTIHKLRYDSNFKYKIAHNKMFFERIDIAAYDGMYCQMEWFTPVYEA
jgi:AraC family transcriptional regulator